MKREIKFRVYTEIRPEVLGMKYFDLSDTSEKNDTIMQFTGLLDKHGKEIYEGDIVSNGESQNNHCLSGIHEVKLECGGFYPFAISGWEGTMSVEKCEIIGNIYENPDLLTSNK